MAGRTQSTEAAAGTAKRRGRPVDQDSQQTRATIIATAQCLFGESGYKGVSMDRLARAAGLTVRALYHYFPSKRELFTAATEEALERFGAEVVSRVFVHDALPDRVRGFIDVYRSLYRSDPQVLAFIGMVLVDGIANEPSAGGQAASTTSDDLEGASVLVRALNEALVDEAISRGEVHAGVDREGALLLLETIGMGLSLAALDDKGTFLPMLDALERLSDGSLYARRPDLAPQPNKK